jgi:hypothetical protein
LRAYHWSCTISERKTSQGYGVKFCFYDQQSTVQIKEWLTNRKNNYKDDHENVTKVDSVWRETAAVKQPAALTRSSDCNTYKAHSTTCLGSSGTFHSEKCTAELVNGFILSRMIYVCMITTIFRCRAVQRWSIKLCETKTIITINNNLNKSRSDQSGVDWLLPPQGTNQGELALLL